MRNYLIGAAFTIFSRQNDIFTASKKWKVKIRREWKESAKFPRKKKKAVRKRLLLDWQIACWNPYEF